MKYVTTKLLFLINNNMLLINLLLSWRTKLNIRNILVSFSHSIYSTNYEENKNIIISK